jgi:hypothetical protein
LIKKLWLLLVQKKFRRITSGSRNKRYAAFIFGSARIAIFTEHSTAAMHNTIIPSIA